MSKAGTNTYHSVHGGAVCQLLGNGDCQFLSAAASASRDRRRIVKVDPLLSKFNSAQEKATTTKEIDATKEVEVAVGVTPFSPTRLFGIMLLVVHVGVCIGIACLADSNDLGKSSPQLYNNYIGVALMMLVGFGYLMTFLKFYGLGAVGLTFLITCLSIECALLFEHLIAHGAVPFTVDIAHLLEANFAAATFLISFGGLLGKVSPTQTIVLVVLESIFYSANRQLILVRWLSNVAPFADVGGSISIHLFGAYFGLAAAFVLRPPSEEACERAEKTSIVSDVTSLIGTTFLWLYWPSFVAGAIPPGTAEAETAITNTILALVGSTIVTFALSALLSRGRLRAVDVQNATLAGGVTIGAVANFKIQPVGAIGLGTAAGIVSTFGYQYVQPKLAQYGLHDTCGIHNLHGMPALLGGVISIILPACIDLSTLAHPGIQAAATALTLVVAIITGTLTGLCMRLFKDDHDQTFQDDPYWEVAEEGKQIV